MSRSTLLTYALRACLALILFIPQLSFAVDCTGAITWTSGVQGALTREWAGSLYSCTAANGWDGAADNPAVNGDWTLIGACGTTEPKVITNNESAVTSAGMTFNGTVTSDEGFVLTDRGFIWGTSSADVTSSIIGSLSGTSTAVSEGGIAVAAYNSIVAGLCPGTTIYIKAYATNSQGTGYGINVDGTTFSPGIYTSTQDGPFSNAATWGGCGPPSLSVANDIRIGHAVTNGGTTIAGGANVTVTNGGVFTVTGTISMGAGGTNLTVDVGGAVQVTDVTYTTDGTITSNGGFTVTNNFNVQSNGTATFNGTTTIGGDASASGPGDFDITGGTFLVTGDLNTSADGTMTADGTITVGGDWNVYGSGSSIVGGTVDVAGKLSVENNGWIIGSGTISWGTKDINPANSGAFVGCSDGSKYDDNGGTAGWAVPPANPWNLNSCASGVLPIELLAFEVEKKDNYVEVSWLTASEKNSDFYEVLASKSGIDWKVISTVKAAGNSSNVLSYEVEDDQLDGFDEKYYRLKQMDFSGKSYLSAIEVVKFNSQGRIISFYDDGSNLKIVHDIVGESVIFSLYNAVGELVYIESVSGISGGTGSISVPSYNLVSGLYFVSLNVDNQVFGKKVLINKLFVK